MKKNSMAKGFRYGRRPDVGKVPDFPRSHTGRIKAFHHMNMALNIGGLLIPCDLETYKMIRKNFKVGDVVAVTMFPWGQIKSIKKVESDHEK